MDISTFPIFFHNKPVLVTGGAGFIGSHLIDALCQHGAKVTVLDDLSAGERDNIAAILPIQFIQGSLLDTAIVQKAVDGNQIIFHLAARGSVPMSVEHPVEFVQANIIGTQNLLEAARKANVHRMIFSSSSSVYGSNPIPWIETMPMLPLSPYAATKAAGESLLRAYSNSYNLDTCSLRYFNIFGPRQNPDSAYAAVIAAFAKAALQNKQPVIYGDGLQSRDFTFVANAVHANLLAAVCATPIKGEAINVGCGNPITVNALAESIGELAGCTNFKPIYKPDRAGDLKHSYADLTKAKNRLNYSPVVDLKTGLNTTLQWYREYSKYG